MSSAGTLEEEIRRLIIDRLELDVAPAELSLSGHLRDDLGLDSAALLEVVAVLEEAFGVEVDLEDVTVENFRSIRTLAHYVAALRDAGEG